MLEQYELTHGEQAVGPEQAYMITSILADNWARTPLQGPNSPLKLSIPAAAKTGSTDDYKDSWTIGYTPDLVTGVWVGNTDNKPMKEVVGSLGAGRIWHDFMENVHQGKPALDFTPPAGVVEYRLCEMTGRPATPDCKETVPEVWPQDYTPEQFARIPGLPYYGPKELADGTARGGKLLGQAVSRQGWDLAPIPTPTPTPRR